MTAVAVRAIKDEKSNEVAAYDGPLTTLGRWAEDARQAAAVAVSLAKTPFVPASLRDRNDDGVTAANICAAILTGQELGLEPMAAMRSLDVIQGMPALRAVALRAVVLAAGHDMWVVEATNERAIVAGQRRGSDHIQESTWTMDRARALGIAGKDNWRKQPGAMLIARATSECARLVAADAILGVPYAAEELDDGLDSLAVTELPPAAGEKPKRTARRQTRQAPATARGDAPAAEPDALPEPELVPPVSDVSDTGLPSDEPEPISEPQSKKLHAVLNELGVSERDYKLRIARAITQRPELSTSNDLTKAEATTLIDTLESVASRENPADNLAFIVEAAEAQATAEAGESA